MERAQGLIRQHGALDDTIARARHYAAIARDALGLFPDGEPKHALTEVVDFCVERAY
jgi:octaprenyl-diphosphate synthase